MPITHTFQYLKSKGGQVQRISATKKLTRSKAIYYHCLDCSGGLIKEAHRCPIKTCPIYPYRPRSAVVSKENGKHD